MSAQPRSLSAIVLLAHGPAADTLTAARRLEARTNDRADIIVVEATPPGATAVDRARDRGYSTALSLDDDRGETAGELAALIRGLDGCVLVIHDDLKIDDASIDAIIEAHSTTGLVAVPGTAPDVGPIDIVCAVGSPARLGDLAAQAAFGPGMTVDVTVAHVPDATFHHRHACQSRTIEPQPASRPLLVAGLIVRDEEEVLEECLASLAGVVDRIEVVDTGSIDATIEIARRAGANVTEIDWRNDFAWARNHTLERCSDAQYMVWIDADERFSCDDVDGFRRMLATYHRLYPSYSMRLHNLKRDGTETHSFVARRIANPAVVRFRGAIHEQVERTDATPLVTAFVTNASIRHLGYDEDVVDLRRKMERNLAIAQQGFDAEPSETNAVQLARALRGASIDPEETLRKIVPIRATLTDASAPVQALMSCLEAELLLAADRLEEAIAAATATLDLVPADAIAGAVLAESLRRSNRIREVVSTATGYAERQSPTPLFVDHVAEQTRARIVFEAAIQLDDAQTASRYVVQLPPQLNPWPVLAEHLEIDHLVELAETAAGLDDDRYVRTVMSQSALTPAQVDRVATAFASSTHSLVGELINGARDELDLRQEHVELRRTFEASDALDDVVAYVRCLISGHVDLAIELDDALTGPEPAAAALGIAAEAHSRHGDPLAAVADAEASIQRWPGSTRAASIAAESALEHGDPDRALEIIEATRTSEETDRITRKRRQTMAALASHAHLTNGNLQGAVSEAVEVVEDGGTFAHWGPLLAASEHDMESLALVVGLALLSDGAEFVDALAHAVAPARTAEICGTYLALGGRNPDAVSIGVLAAIMSSQDELALLIADHGHLLPQDIRARLAAHLRSSGARDAALRLMVDQTERQAA